MSDGHPVIFLSAAEASGDAHAADLVVALRRRFPGARLVGVTGEKMARAGCESVADFTRSAAMMGNVLATLGYWIRAVRSVRRAIREIRPDLFIPVDSPALNWSLAKTARQDGARVMHYICPQIWAWAPWRITKLARLTDHVACILPFEQRYLRDRGIEATYVGHPLFDQVPPRPAELPNLLDAWADGEWRIVLLPGSRASEICYHAPALLAAAAALRRRWPKARCFLSARTAECDRIVRRVCSAQAVRHAEIVVGRTAELLADAHFALAGSGTVTLEVAHYGVPMVTFYRTSRLLHAVLAVLGRWAVPTPHFALVNILAGQRLVPELIPWHGDSRQLVRVVRESMEDLGGLLETRERLLAMTDSLRLPAGQTAADNAAAVAAEMLA